jgi:hypothetical protein
MRAIIAVSTSVGPRAEWIAPFLKLFRPDLYTFDRKLAFYEKHHQRQATRKIEIAPVEWIPDHIGAQKDHSGHPP